MANYDLIFDLGSENVSAATKNDGFCDKIPAVVAYGSDSTQILAVGVEAKRMYHASSGAIKLVRPILEGAVIDVEGAKALISALLSRLANTNLKFFVRYNIYCIVPCGMISSDKKTIESILLSLGAKQVSFVETPIADSLKLFGEFRARQGIVVDIGYDCTDLAIVAANNIVNGCTLYHSGKHLTEAIIERIKAKYMILLSFEQAEYLKINCASLYANDTTVVSVMGQNIQYGSPETVNISSKELYDTIVDFVKKYVVVIQSLVDTAPSDIAGLVKNDGVMLCGGGARLAGLDIYLQQELGLPVKVASSPEDVSINGMLEYNK
ncbi:MAG: rod shape-determining protein [Clostridia bacterium]|nr:rod shape-determining protein [Clostridia bacterium]